MGSLNENLWKGLTVGFSISILTVGFSIACSLIRRSKEQAKKYIYKLNLFFIFSPNDSP